MTIRIPGTGSVSVPANGRMKVSPSFTPMTAVGGAEATLKIDNVTYKVHTFTGVGILTVTSAENNIGVVEYLVLAGGGGGGSPAGTHPGGGGAGGYRTGTVSLNVGTYTIGIGAGGAISTNGEDSFIGNSPTGPYIILSNGGGGGGDYPSNAGDTGGSGGGGGGANPFNPSIAPGGLGIPTQGTPGGDAQQWAPSSPNPRGGGGGGAGGAGTPGGSGGAGGIGAYNTLAGGSVYYAYGGNGGNGSSAPNNSGGGGGGNNTGGSGIVIIRYRIS